MTKSEERARQRELRRSLRADPTWDRSTPLPIRAAWPGTCIACDQPYSPGDQLAKHRETKGRMVHYTCPTRRPRRRTRKPSTPKDSTVRTTLDPAIRLTEAEQHRLVQFGTLRKPDTTSTTNRTWEQPQGRQHPVQRS